MTVKPSGGSRPICPGQAAEKSSHPAAEGNGRRAKTRRDEEGWPIDRLCVITDAPTGGSMTQPAELYATKSDFAYTRVREQILSGELEPGSVINQAVLAREIGISTTPLREALRRLMQQGLVELD